MLKYYRPMVSDGGFERIYRLICKDLLCAPPVNTGHWQAKRDTPMSHTRELQNVVLELPIPATPGAWASWVRPNLPWAEDHFLERVSGVPHNPPPSHTYWPFNQAENKDHMDGERFSHTYPERMWPRFAGGDFNQYVEAPRAEEVAKLHPDVISPNHGIRYQYGDLDNAVDLLVQEPHTRQCYIPMWFPEDLHAAAVEHQRVPCTLGWHAVLRDGKLNIFYPMRSCDALRYMQDDLYMAGRLAHWLIDECQKNSHDNSVWQEAVPGTLTAHMVSLHCFEGDVPILKLRLGDKNKVTA